MRGTQILYAHPETFRLLSEDCRRFSMTRTRLRERLYAAYLVFTGKADALSWSELPNEGERAPSGLATKPDGGWRDISAAPMDGTPFLAWETEERGPFKCWWHSNYPRSEGYWMDDADSEPRPRFCRPMIAGPTEVSA